MIRLCCLYRHVAHRERHVLTLSFPARRASVIAEERAVAAAARRQSALLGVVITVLMALLLVLWAQLARAAVGEPAITDGQVEQSIEMAKTPRELFVGDRKSVG